MHSIFIDELLMQEVVLQFDTEAIIQYFNLTNHTGSSDKLSKNTEQKHKRDVGLEIRR